MTIISEVTHSGDSELECLKCGKSYKMREMIVLIHRKEDADVEKACYFFIKFIGGDNG